MIPNDTQNCWSCKWVRTVPGSAHRRCAHPKLAAFYELLEKQPMLELGLMLGSVGRGPTMTASQNPLNVRGDPQGIAHGWFNWPYEYDPTWLENCDGYEAKEKVEAAKP